MRVAFYAPLKPLDHPKPSGERSMAGLLAKALKAAGCDIRIASRFCSRSDDAGDDAYRTLKAEALAEVERLTAIWSSPDADWRPHFWFTYHPYYRSPDWIGPEVCSRLKLPYLTAEASYAGKRDADHWRRWQADVVTAVRGAAANFCFTAQDREGLERLMPLAGPVIELPPFTDPPPMPERQHRSSTAAPRIAVTAMMRSGDKLASYRFLAEALQMLRDVPWRLAVIGDGPARGDVLAAFSGTPPDRIDWLGEVEPDAVWDRLADCDLYAWPGIGEAYGVAYLEAQAMGLPVVAQNNGGVPTVVMHGQTGWLTPAGHLAGYAAAIRRMLLDSSLRLEMGHAASRFVRQERSLGRAAAILRSTLEAVVPRSGGAA